MSKPTSLQYIPLSTSASCGMRVKKEEECRQIASDPTEVGQKIMIDPFSY